MSAQDLKDHQWKNRILLVFADDITSELLDQQLEEWQKVADGLAERKLLVYQITPTHFKVGLQSKEWQERESQFKKFDSRKSFEVLLIGLDGGVKLRKTEVLTRKALFSIIDAMPMRILEMESKE